MAPYIASVTSGPPNGWTIHEPAHRSATVNRAGLARGMRVSLAPAKPSFFARQVRAARACSTYGRLRGCLYGNAQIVLDTSNFVMTNRNDIVFGSEKKTNAHVVKTCNLKGQIHERAADLLRHEQDT